MNEIKLIFNLVRSSDIATFRWILSVMFVSAIVDTAGIASILPFIALLAKPEIVSENGVMESLFRFTQVSSVDHFLILVGTCCFLLILASNALKCYLLYVGNRYAHFLEALLCERLLSKYLDSDYEQVTTRSNSEMMQNVLSETAQILGGFVNPVLTVITQSLVCVLLLATLVVLEPAISVIAGGVLLAFFSLVFSAIKTSLDELGRKREKANASRYQVTSEAVGNLLVNKIYEQTAKVSERFKSSSRQYANSQALSATIAQVPRFVFEGFAFGGMVILLLTLLFDRGTLVAVLPVMSLMAFASYRLLPAFQMIYSGLASIKYSMPSVLKYEEEITALEQRKTKTGKIEVHDIQKNIELTDLSYRYPNASEWVFQNLNLKINAKTTVGIVGQSGIGKTTFIELLCGMRTPTSGKIKIDDTEYEKLNVKAFRRLIGIVQQRVFLTSGTFLSNIAPGDDEKEIDYEWVRQCARIADIDEFIEKRCTEQYATKIGPGYIELSLGQAQRVSIASALYRRPKILILDEGTSALDEATEGVVINNLRKLKEDMVIIIVTHRKHPLSICDTIIDIKDII